MSIAPKACLKLYIQNNIRLQTFRKINTFLSPTFIWKRQTVKTKNNHLQLECSHRYSSKLSNLSQSKRNMGDSMWKPPPPCKVGDLIEQIDTPALIIDLDKMDKNLNILPSMMAKFPGVSYRPHAKAHKSPAIGALQIKHGAVGLCCQTLVESEAMVYGGEIKDILLSNQLIGKAKLKRFANLGKKSNISICVDDINNIRDMSEVASQAGVEIGCVVEVNVGQDRCGVPPGRAAVELAKEIQRLPSITFKGLQCYQGANQHIRKSDDRQKAVDLVIERTKQTLEALASNGIECKYVTGGGTGTFPFEAKSGLFTEVQPGSYLFMDADYGRNFGEDGKNFQDFQHSLYVLTTVQSATPNDRVVVDAGMKAVSMDSGVPLVTGAKDIEYIIGGDEHGILKPSGNYKIGDLIWLIPGHCDPTVNLYDWIVGVRNGTVETVWPVTGRGPGV